MATREYRRRHVVRAVGLVAATGAAGCLGDENGDAVEPDDEETDAPADDGPEDDGPADDEVESDDSGEEGTDGPEDDDAGADGVEGDETDPGQGETGDEQADGDDIEDEDTNGENTEEDGTETDDSDREDDTDGEEAEGTTDDPDGFDTYTDEELGYGVSHPEDWEIEEGDGEVYIGDPDGGRELGILAFDAAAFDSAEALAAEFLASLETDYEGVEVREEADRTLESGQEARLLDIAYDNPDDDRGRRRSRLLFAIDPDTNAGYVAEVAASAEAFDDAFEERADAMLDSFRLEGDGLDRAGQFASVFISGSVIEGMAVWRLGP